MEDLASPANPTTKVVEVEQTVTIELCKYGLTFVDGQLCATPAEARKAVKAALPSVFVERKRKAKK